MNNDREFHWSKWSGGKVKRSVERFPCGYAWFEGSLAQEVECDFFLVQYFVLHVLGEGWINTRYNGQKMRFERFDGPLRCVATMDIGRDEFIFSVPGVFDDIFVCSTCSIV